MSPTGEDAHVPSGMRAEVEQYIRIAHEARMAGDDVHEVHELRAVQRWVSHLLRVADLGRETS